MCLQKLYVAPDNETQNFKFLDENLIYYNHT